MALSLVTGGAGFIGSNMVRFLLDKGQNVRVLDNFETGKRENLAEISDSIEVIEGDIRDLSVVQRAVKGAEVIYHLAALGSVPRSMKDPATTHDVNVNGTFNVLLAARDANVKRIVFASSSSVYGQSPVLPQHEDLPLAPISPYGATKAIGEIYFRSFYATYGLQSVCLRYYNVFGPRQDPTSQYAAAIPLFVSALMRDKSPNIFDDGEQSRGFTYIENVMQANWLAANAKETHGEAANISTSNAVTVNTVVQTISKLLGKENIKPVYLPPRRGDIKHSLADVKKAKELIGYEPFVSFEQGIAKAIDWYKENL
ncbi:MAG: Vi polysaccharide biosynthesis protein VipB/TviC [Planctomycetes bacterium GWF2_41_51]|nr:MAG: Vi polysaccharide biosynthesis protein VipB/TviC [Planctomycetes bacterium GWF2_41_51]HBG28793.1 LPS biosynthesis protein WbpP [Phycisphaerales bacterium]